MATTRIAFYVFGPYAHPERGYFVREDGHETPRRPDFEAICHHAGITRYVVAVGGRSDRLHLVERWRRGICVVAGYDTSRYPDTPEAISAWAARHGLERFEIVRLAMNRPHPRAVEGT